MVAVAVHFKFPAFLHFQSDAAEKDLLHEDKKIRAVNVSHSAGLLLKSSEVFLSVKNTSAKCF